MAETATDPPLVCVRYVEGHEYDAVIEAAEGNAGGSTWAVTEHLAQWDFGDEIDGITAGQTRPLLSEVRSQPHQWHPVEYHGTQYFLQLDHQYGFYALYRQPLRDDD